MRFISWILFCLVAFIAVGCGTSSTTVTGPSLDRCSISVANSMARVDASGGSGRVTVTAGRECTWSLTSSVPWITPRPAATGQGDGSAEFVVAANPNVEMRRGTVVVGGQVLEVVQDGVTCRFDLQPTSQNVGAEGSSGSFAVETPSACSWTPTASDGWITIQNSGSRNGSGSVNFTVAANTGGVRDGTINVGGQAFTILQAAPSCRFQLSPAAGSFGGAGGSGTINVTVPATCNWNASTTVPWISIVGDASGTGNGTVGFTVQPNTGPARSGIITVGGQRFTVTQQQAACTYSISPAGQSFPTAGGQGTVSVSTNSVCTWNTSDVPVWVTGMPPTGSGAQTLTFTVEPNAGPGRTANVIIAGQTFAISQTGGCSFSLAPGSYSATAAGGQSSVVVNTSAGCNWTSSGVPAWVTGIPGSGAGTTTLDFTVAANPNPSPRSANINIGGRTFTVSQAAAACNFSLSPTDHSAAAAGGASAFNVNTSAACDWTTSGVPSWITGVPASGTGPQTINFSVAANTGGARTANIVVSGQTFAVSQAAASCSYSLAPAGHNAAAGGGTSSFDVNTGSSCAWTSSGVPSWISGVPASGTGTTTINFSVAANPDAAARNANITIGGQTFAVTQAGASCSFSLSPSSHNATASGGSSTFDVNTTSGCSWTSSGVPGWITGVPASGTGTTTINFTVAANPDSSQRSANINIGGQTFAVTQAAAAVTCSFTLSPNSHNAPAAGGSSTFDVQTTSTCGWTSSGVPSWITGVPASGTGTTTINFTVAANPDAVSRSANFSVGGQTFSVTQAAAACSYSLSPTSHKADATGGTSTFAVNTASGCNWTSSGTPSWISGVPSSGTGPATINFTVAANTGPARNANIVIGGQTFAVSQANGCTYAVSPQQLTFDDEGEPAQNVSVTAGALCPWTATPSQSWIRILSGESGNGDGTVRVELRENNDGSVRTGTISIGGQTVNITQNP